MVVEEVNGAEYTQVLSIPTFIFNTSAFNVLNAGKVESVRFLVFKDSRVRMGLIGGVKKNGFYSPFSAPFGGFTMARQAVTVKQMEEAVEQLIFWCASKGLEQISLVPPPLVYDETNLSKLTNVLFRAGFTQRTIDLNYSFFLEHMNDSYVASLPKNARKNLKKALSNDLKLHQCGSMEEKELAYSIIKQNRSERGFPLRMTWEQVAETTELVPADFFLVSYENTFVASAVVFHIFEDIVQVIYWGDVPAYAELRPMNFISYELFRHYQARGMRIIDIGPSTENSQPNHGLCEFKESIGCDVNLKTTWTYQFS